MKNHHMRVLLAVLTIVFTSCAKKNFFASTPVADPVVYEKLKTASPDEVDSVVVQPGKHYQRGWLHRLFWGRQYRKVWNAPVKVEVFDKTSTKGGGLEVEKLGGGMQTTSLTLVNKDNFTYALRSLDKDPVGILPKAIQKTVFGDIVRDQTSAINPYAAIVLPVMAEAAGIPHSTPELVYVLPSDTSFGEYSERFQDKVFMIEEKYDDDRTITPQLGNAVDIVSSKKLLKNRFGDDDHFIDQRAFAKARLFDILVNDWDRHEDQWEWAKYEADGDKIYRPIPKDRDNAFFDFDSGIFTWLLSRRWSIRKFHSFSEKYNDVGALTVNAQFIDNRALSEVTADEFQALANELQNAITDEVIEKAVQQFPDTVYELIGEETLKRLKNRRDNLHQAAHEYYLILAKNVLVVGTDKEDIFEVKRLNDEETSVTVYREADNKQVYHRVFRRNETKQISLHGLAEDDIFNVSGEVDKGIRIVIVGGRGEDEITDTSRVKKQIRKKTIVFDTKLGNELKFGPETVDNTTNDVRVHAFDREGF